MNELVPDPCTRTKVGVAEEVTEEYADMVKSFVGKFTTHRRHVYPQLSAVSE